MAGIKGQKWSSKKWNNKVRKEKIDELYDNMMLMLGCWKVRYDSMENVSWILDKVETQLRGEYEDLKNEAE